MSFLARQACVRYLTWCHVSEARGCSGFQGPMLERPEPVTGALEVWRLGLRSKSLAWDGGPYAVGRCPREEPVLVVEG